MTIDEFLAWQIGQGQRYQLVAGEPVPMAGAKPRHDRVTGNAFSEVRRQIRAIAGACDVYRRHRHPHAGREHPPAEYQRPVSTVR
jgi:Uma2 family endonuclease